MCVCVYLSVCLCIGSLHIQTARTTTFTVLLTPGLSRVNPPRGSPNLPTYVSTYLSAYLPPTYLPT